MKWITGTIFAALVAFSAPAYSDGGHGPQVNYTSQCGFDTLAFYDSGHDSERWSQLVLGSTRWEVFHVNFTANPGDVIKVVGDGEATNSRGVNTEFTTIFNLHVDGFAKTEMSEENGYNITSNMHHGKANQHGIGKIPDTAEDGVDVKVSWDWHAANGSASPQYLWVGCCDGNWNDYGRITVTHLRPKTCP